MPNIYLQTFIGAPIEIVFDVSRSVDVHKSSMLHHKEEIIGGVSKGLMQEGDVVIWQATHLFKRRILKVKITDLQPYAFFMDEMVSGDFKAMQHKHYFEKKDDSTIMTDLFYFSSPFGIVGKMADTLFLKKYMTRLLLERNEVVKKVAETDEWKNYLNK